MTVRGENRKGPRPRPGKIVAVGVNFAGHAAEAGYAPTAKPRVFLKAPSAVVGDGHAIVLPPNRHEWSTKPNSAS